MKALAARLASLLALSLPAAVLVVSAICFANGGPVGSTTATGRGNGAPKRRSSIRLVSEKLSIKLDADGMHYDALAEYVLSNPGPATEVLYGVPFRLGDESEGPLPKVTVSVGEQAYDCRFGRRRRRPAYDEEAAERENAKVLPPEDEMLRGPDTWCTTRISVPTGERIPLSLSYRAELVYDDESFSKTFFTTYSDRWLVYSFAPAGGWQGPADQISITLDLGPYAGFETISGLRGFRREGSQRLWSQNQVDLARLGPLKVKLDVSPVLDPRDLLKWRRKTGMRFAAREVGHVPSAPALDGGAPPPTGQSAAAQVADGNSATAWCAGGDVRGRSFEVSWKPPRVPGGEDDVSDCSLEAFAVFPGDLSSQEAYEEKRKVSRVRFEACGGATSADKGKPTNLELAMKPGFSYLASMHVLTRRVPESIAQKIAEAHRAKWDGLESRIRGWEISDATGALVVAKEKKGQINKARNCVRVVILDAEGDPAQPACLSEITPVFNCG